MKRLHFEAITLVMSDLKSQISTTDASEPTLRKFEGRRPSKLESLAYRTGMNSNHHMAL